MSCGSSEAAAKVVEEIKALGGEAIANGSSVTDDAGVAHMVKQAIDAWGRVDILVANAGVLRDKSFAKMEIADFEFVLNVHLMGTVKPVKALWEIMREQNYGRIVVTTSSTGLYGNFGQVNYSSAKMGLVGMGKSIAVEGAKYNIKANVIAPVAVSRMTASLMTEEMKKMTPEQVAPVVAYLSHEDCAISGQILSAYGGHVGRVFVGETRGLNKPDLTVEDVADNLDQILNQDGYLTPETLSESMQL